MSTPRAEQPSTDEVALLEAVYEPFAQTAVWPQFSYVSYGLWRQTQTHPRSLYQHMASRGLVQPPLPGGGSSEQEEETQVMVTLEGLFWVPPAQEDIQHLLEAVRIIARIAIADRPQHPPTNTALIVDSDDVANELKLPVTDLAVRRLGALLRMVDGIWSGYGETQEGKWRLTVRPQVARGYADVESIRDLISPRPNQAMNSAGDDEDPTAAAPSDEDRPQDADAEAERFAFGRNVASDLPTVVDRLGFKPVVRALHGLLNDSSTSLPLAIAITAPWGAGKSSVMEQLRGELDKARDGSQRKWTTVRFEAWKYERSERLWAALAKAIYVQSQAQMSAWERLRFRVTLEFRRRGWLGFGLAAAWPVIVLSALVVSAAQIGLSGPGAVPAILAGSAVLLVAAARFGSALVNPFKTAVDRHARKPDYETQLGFTAEADRDISILTRLIAPDTRHGLAVFVDDLDRCSSTHLVEVVEAMNQIFNSASDHQCLFVLGLDRDVVATNIEVAYEPTVAKLSKRDSGRHFGFEFLAKLVQLSVALPEPAPEALAELAQELGGRQVPPPATKQKDATETRFKVEQERRLPGSSRSSSLQELRSDAPAQTGEEAEDVRRRTVSEVIQDSPRVAAAMEAAIPFLERNPRQVKRFHNAFRLQLYVASEDERVRFDFSDAELEVLARWVAMRLRWPRLGDDIVRNPELLRNMEASANGEQPFNQVGEAKDVRDWLAQPGVKALFTTSTAMRLSSLDVKAFLRVI